MANTRNINSPYSIDEIVQEVLNRSTVFPLGWIGFWWSETLPAGYARLDGRTLTYATYPEFCQWVWDNNLWGSGKPYGGDGSTYIVLPNFDGQFIRCHDGSGTIDPSRDICSFQTDALQDITATFNAFTYGTGVPTGACTSVINSANSVAGGTTASYNANTFTFNASNVVRTATETRPKNYAMVAMIKVKNVVGYDPAVANGNALTLGGIAPSGFAPAIGDATKTFSVKNATANDHAVNLGQFTNSKAESGYTYLPNGLIIQWGRVLYNVTAGATQYFTMPITFPTASLLTVGCQGTQGATVGVASYTASQVQVTSSVTSRYVQYIAIGY